MCFSPAASFTVSAGLAAAGVVTLGKTSSKRELLFAAMPLFFAGQQFIEGLLWLALLVPERTQYWLTQGYSVFVGVLWPILTPLALWMIEPEPRRRRARYGMKAHPAV